MAETFEAHTAIISNHPAYHPWLTLYIWRYIGLTLDRIARWRKPVHVIRVEFNFLRTRDARVAHRVCVCVHACIFTRVIRTTRWKRMDKEGRGQEPWTTFRLPIRVRSIHVASRLIQGLPIFLYFIRIYLLVRRFVCVAEVCVSISRNWFIRVCSGHCRSCEKDRLERKRRRGGWYIGWMSGKAIVKWDVMSGLRVCVRICVWMMEWLIWDR